MRKRFRLGALLAAVALAVIGCTENNTQDIDLIFGPGGVAVPSPSPSPTPIVGCPVVNGLNVSLNSTTRTTFAVNVSERLDATPTSGGRGVGDQCHERSITWTISENGSCALEGDVSGFNPSIRCTQAGPVLVTATLPVSGVTRSNRFTVTAG